MSDEIIKTPFDAQLDITKTYEEQDKLYVEGYAATTDYDDQGDVITPEAIKQSENDLLERSTVLLNHDKDRPIGKVEEAKGDTKGLRIKVLISKAEPEIRQKIKEGIINKFSIRGSILESTKEKIKQAGKDILANVIKAMKLIEVSMVSLPANSEAKTLAWYMSKAIETEETNKTYTAKEVDALKKEIQELKGYSIVDGVMVPHSYMRVFAQHMKGMKDRKLSERVTIKAIGSIKSMSCDEDCGDTCEVEIEEGELSEVQKSMSDIKKKDGTLYTQEEVDALEVKIEGITKEIADAKVSQETKDAELGKSIGEKDVQLKDVSKKLEDASKELEEVKKERDEMKAKQADEDINKKVDAKWSELEVKSYKKEDASIIKPILKKGFMGVALTPEDTDALISKKITGSILKLGFDPIAGSVNMTKERREELISIGGIKVKK